MSAKNVTVLTLAGEVLHRTLKTARRAVERGTHSWLDFGRILQELEPGTSNSDPARFHRASLNRPGQYAPPAEEILPAFIISAGSLAPVELPNCKFIPPVSMPRPTIAAISEGWNWQHEPGALPAAVTLRPEDWQ